MKSRIKRGLGLFELKKKKMNAVRGGHCCCGCLYEDQGGSSMMDNGLANAEKGLHSPIPICEGTHDT